MKLSKKEQKKIDTVLKTVKEITEKKEAVKGAYFWTPPSSANQRRSMEAYHDTVWIIGS
jgi:predicted small secreted protein